MGAVFTPQAILGLTLYVIFFGFVIYIFLSDPDSSSTSQFIKEVFPAHCRRLGNKYIGVGITSSVANAVNYVTVERNPLMQLMYLAIVFGAWTVIIFEGFNYIPNEYMAEWHEVRPVRADYLEVTTAFLACFSKHVLSNIHPAVPKTLRIDEG
jgi:hypothetical protein